MDDQLPEMPSSFTCQRMIFERNGLCGAPDVFNRSGMTLKDDGTVWTVSKVYAGGPAEQAGIRQGDAVIAINGKSRADLERTSIRAAMRQAEGTIVTLRVRTGAAPRFVTLRLRDVL